MTLTDRQATNLEMEFLQQDLGRLPEEMPVSTIKRELTRALYERVTVDEGTCPRPIIPATHSAVQDAVRAVVGALDKLVTAWAKAHVTPQAQPQVVDGVRAAATLIAEAAQRAGLTTPDQPLPEAPYELSDADLAADQLADRYEVVDETYEFTSDDTKRIAEALRSVRPLPPHGVVIEGSTVDGQPVAEWAPSDGGLTPSIFGGI